MFFDREEEIERLLEDISYEPNMVTFVYGPINSGKTTLIQEFLKRTSEKYVGFYINFRKTPVANYEEFSRVLFSFDSRIKMIKDVISILGKVNPWIPIPREVLNDILRDKEPINAFSYLREVLEEIRSSGKMPILVFDELQVIKDLKVNGSLIYQLFNFLIHLSKEAHLAHVFAVTSDFLFISEIFGNAKLSGRASYFPVYDLPEEKAIEFLLRLNLSEEESRLVVEYFGGKPSYLVEAPKHRKHLREWCERELTLRAREIRRFKSNLLLEFMDEEEVEVEELSEEAINLVNANILFYDPLRGTLRPQGKLELLAIRKVIKG